ncbi:CCCH-type zinc finger-containing protein [Cavenderia fasciculata]|uniref:CCCH-type zinc finger-containing protein n=1 Tax=Cavenderia fasciculata TaxID=261658 RepID=F4PLI8_CACFS|nr:CCCH-type zinc finger-containing protein [Cavenderia fasciculata]EGG23410.1 CCCH-type zinc finger-containing protein [Cavenderia fasciculata]|eukprot:XP_004361261.1 CCCH-type zinc finger-containing protein [Cavenderia fasciculata]
MPPKESKKAVEKDKQKKVEDKTFGLKNKNKSKKVQQFVKTVEQQATANANQKKVNHKAEMAKKEKELKEKAKQDMAAFLQPTIIQAKVPLGVDPKSIVCEFFKAGSCAKGNKCKFAHDLNVARKDAKIDIYTDRRNGEDKEKDLMETWDDDKLKSVVSTKQTQTNKNLKTAIVCKFFLEAIESAKYGWFWECPNGASCMYQHCLPPGFVLQKKKTKEDEVEEIPIEELIEEERAKLTKSTPVTLETFTKWKAEKKIQKEKAAKDAEEKRMADIKAGKTSMSGREMFVFNPDLFVDDDFAIDVTSKEFEVDPNDVTSIASTVDKSLFIEDDDIPDMSDDDEDEDDDEDDGEDQEEDEEDDE